MSYLLAGIFIMACVTYLPRVVPLLLIKKPIQSCFIQTFLYYIPYAVLTAMTFPAIFSATGNFTSGVVGAMVSILLAYFGGSLLKVSLIAVAIVYIVNGML